MSKISMEDFDKLSRNFGSTRRHPDFVTVDVYSMNQQLIATRVDNGRGRESDDYYATEYGHKLLASLDKTEKNSL